LRLVKANRSPLISTIGGDYIHRKYQRNYWRIFTRYGVDLDMDMSDFIVVESCFTNKLSYLLIEKTCSNFTQNALQKLYHHRLFFY